MRVPDEQETYNRKQTVVGRERYVPPGVVHRAVERIEQRVEQVYAQRAEERDAHFERYICHIAADIPVALHPGFEPSRKWDHVHAQQRKGVGRKDIGGIYEGMPLRRHCKGPDQRRRRRDYTQRYGGRAVAEDAP